jgi:hypothetical protein
MSEHISQVGPISINATKLEDKLILEYNLMVVNVPPELERYVHCSINGCENYAYNLVKASESKMVLLCRKHFEKLESEVAEMCRSAENIIPRCDK